MGALHSYLSMAAFAIREKGGVRGGKGGPIIEGLGIKQYCTKPEKKQSEKIIGMNFFI